MGLALRAAAVAIMAFGAVFPAIAADVYLRFQVTRPSPGAFKVTTGGYRHAEPWYFPSQMYDAEAGQWSQWIDLTKLPLHGKINRSGGVAEWPTLSLTLASAQSTETMRGCALRVQQRTGRIF